MASIEPVTTTTTTTPRTKASAFINVTVVDKSGEQKKNLGGVPLYADNAFHKALLEHLKAGHELTLETGIHMVTDKVDFAF